MNLSSSSTKFNNALSLYCMEHPLYMVVSVEVYTRI